MIPLSLNKSPPPWLLRLPIWCLYRLEQREGEIKPSKVPYQPNGERARPNCPDTLTSYDAVMDAFQQGGYDGIGFRIPDGVAVIDVDDMGDALSDLAKELIQHFDSYAELSPGGNGIHIILPASGFVMDKERYYTNNRAMKLEAYVGAQTNRFMTFTSKQISQSDYSDQDKTTALVEFMEKYMRRPDRPAPRQGAPPAEGVTLTEDEIIAKISSSKQGEAFMRLMQGDISGYPSHSEADLALSNILAFWCGRDMKRMDSIFRRSKLVRPKWDKVHDGKRSYGEMTLQRAINDCEICYTTQFIGGANAMIEGKETFVLYLSFFAAIQQLSNEDAGALFKAIFAYVKNGESSELSQAANMAFFFIKDAIDRNAEKYAHACQLKAEAGRRGGVAYGKARASKSKQTKQEEHDSDSGNELEPVNENDNDNDDESESDNISTVLPEEKAHAFVPPTLDAVKLYALTIQSIVDPSKFYNYYSSNGWTAKGGSAIQDWKAAFRGWEKNEWPKSTAPPPPDPPPQPDPIDPEGLQLFDW
ncbi:MAG: DUF6291 domain-containing protein [Oscillospiraceae bacterium]|nr:DUF6291 domain-containing protein [Oscillospiraceae bacterium]